MRPILFAPLALVAGAATADRPSADAELARIVAGRVAGTAVDCVQQIRIDSLRAVGKQTLVARGGNRVWLNRLPEICPSLRTDSIAIVRTFNGEYCRNDVFTAASPQSVAGGTCRLGRFTPYDRPAR